MEQVIAHITSLSNDADRHQLVSQLRTVNLVPHAAQIPDAIQTLDPGQHGVGMSFLL